MEWIFTISTTTSQPSCKVVTTLQGCKHLAQIATTLSQPCHNLTKLQQGCYNLVISVWEWGWGWVGGKAMITTVIDVAVTARLTSNFINEKMVWASGLLLVVKIVNV